MCWEELERALGEKDQLPRIMEYSCFPTDKKGQLQQKGEDGKEITMCCVSTMWACTFSRQALYAPFYFDLIFTTILKGQH